MILELATLGLALACEGQGKAERESAAARIAFVDETRKQMGIPPMNPEEVLAFLLEEAPPFRGWTFGLTSRRHEETTLTFDVYEFVREFQEKEPGRRAFLRSKTYRWSHTLLACEADARSFASLCFLPVLTFFLEDDAWYTQEAIEWWFGGKS